MIDSWNPATFDSALIGVLSSYSNLIVDYHCEDHCLMTAHLNSDPYESLKSNRYSQDYLRLHEDVVTPLFVDRRIRVWHYTRLLDDEVSLMQRMLVPSSLGSLKQRLETLVQDSLLTIEEAEIVYRQSPFHSQGSIRSNRLWTTTVPFSPDYSGVEPFLERWGGEAAYFWLADKNISIKLQNIGVPRIVEIDTDLRDKFNAFSIAKTAISAWGRTLCQTVEVSGSDLAIKYSLDTAQVLRVHTLGDSIFENVANIYPEGCGKLLPIPT